MSMFNKVSRSRQAQDENESVQDMLTAAARSMAAAKSQPGSTLAIDPAPPLPRRKYLSEQSEDGDSILTAYRSRPLSPSNKMRNRKKPNFQQFAQEPKYSAASKPTYESRETPPPQQFRQVPPQMHLASFDEEKSAQSDLDDSEDDDIISHSGVSVAGYSAAESHQGSQQFLSFSRQNLGTQQHHPRSQQHQQYHDQQQHFHEKQSQQSSFHEKPSQQSSFHEKPSKLSSFHEKPSQQSPFHEKPSQQQHFHGKPTRSGPEQLSMDNRRHSGSSMNSRKSAQNHAGYEQRYTPTKSSSRATTNKHSPRHTTEQYLNKHSFPEVVGGGELEASSVGANVRVNWQGVELSRLHFAAIYLRWSVVGVLAESAKQNQRAGGYMVVDLSTLQKENGEALFGEDFPSVFGNIFKDSFVPSVHEKFNHQGGQPSSYMPTNIRDAFKLLVLCERLDAMLREDVIEHIQRLLKDADKDVTPTDSPSFALVATSLEFVGRPPKNSLQESIVQKAIDILVDGLPQSLPALEQLVKVCVDRGNTYMAVLLFRETTETTIKMGQRVANEQTQETIEYMESIKSAFGTTRDRNHVEVFTDMLRRGTDQLLNRSSSRDLSEAGLAFKQGVILHKRGIGSASGSRILRINGDVLQWRKLNNRIWHPEKSIRRSNIIAIVPLTDKGESESFKIRTKNHHTIIFTAQNTDSCRRCVESLVNWWQHQDNSHSGAPLRDVPRPRGASRFASIVWDSVARRRADLERMGSSTRKYGATSRFSTRQTQNQHEGTGDDISVASSALEQQHRGWDRVRQSVQMGDVPVRPERRYGGDSASASQESLSNNNFESQKQHNDPLNPIDDDEFGLEHSISASKLAFGGRDAGQRDVDSGSVLTVRSVGPLL